MKTTNTTNAATPKTRGRKLKTITPAPALPTRVDNADSDVAATPDKRPNAFAEMDRAGIDLTDDADDAVPGRAALIWADALPPIPGPADRRVSNLADVFYAAGYFGELTPPQIAVQIMAGAELGFGPVESMFNLELGLDAGIRFTGNPTGRAPKFVDVGDQIQATREPVAAAVDRTTPELALAAAGVDNVAAFPAREPAGSGKAQKVAQNANKADLSGRDPENGVTPGPDPEPPARPAVAAAPVQPGADVNPNLAIGVDDQISLKQLSTIRQLQRNDGTVELDPEIMAGSLFGVVDLGALNATAAAALIVEMETIIAVRNGWKVAPEPVTPEPALGSVTPEPALAAADPGPGSIKDLLMQKVETSRGQWRAIAVMLTELGTAGPAIETRREKFESVDADAQFRMLKDCQDYYNVKCDAIRARVFELLNGAGFKTIDDMAGFFLYAGVGHDMAGWNYGDCVKAESNVAEFLAAAPAPAAA